MIRIKYQLYKETKDNLNALQQILYNRGIPVEQQETWLNASWPQINDWRLLDESKMIRAVNLVHSAVQENKEILVVVDCDCDGFTSAVILINYLYKLYPNYTKEKVSYILHKGKEHGLADVVNNIPDTLGLVICPDAASNDVEQFKTLAEKDIKVLCLDHHECDADSDIALIINPQISDYPNKALTGAGVVWQFCRAYDEFYSKESPHANDFLDLCALGNCGDMANYKELEIRAFMNLGLNDIVNPFFYAMTAKNKYSIDKMNGINYYSMAFYVVPFINAIVRSGTMEEKETVLKAMLLQYAFDKVESSKRGHRGEKVPLYDEAVLVAERVKRRQTKLQDETMMILDQKIKEENLLNNAIIICTCNPGEVEKSLAGLCANKVQAKYQKPCLVLTKSKSFDDKEYFFRGSARNYSQSELQDLKSICESTNSIEFAAGHANAYGIGIAESQLEDFIQKTNEIYKDIDQTPVYWVDYIWNRQTIDAQKILDIADFTIYGQEIPESYVCLEGITFSPGDLKLMGLEKGHPTLKIQIGNTSLIKFKSSEEEYQKFLEPNMVLTAICKCNKNEWNGNISPQLICEDYELREEWVF